MLTAADCIPCLFRQALNTVRTVSADPAIHLRVLRRVADYAAQASSEQAPADFSRPVYRIVSEETGIEDPYQANKRQTNREALDILPVLRDILSQSDDPLDAALHAAVAGNIIDLGISHTFNIADDITGLMQRPFAINAVEELRGELKPGKKALYLGDNAGEIVFDMLLVEQLQKAGVAVTYTVKSGPVINDATMQDASEVGMTELTGVIETGGADIGVNWSNVSDEFRDAVQSADFLIAKGHGNFETCNTRPENFYFLLKAKCPVVAAALKCREGDIVCAHRKPNVCQI